MERTKGKGWCHTGGIESKRTTAFIFVKDDQIRDDATGDKLEKLFLVVKNFIPNLRGKENDFNQFFNRSSTPKKFMKYWKQYDVWRIKKSMARMGLTKKDL